MSDEQPQEVVADAAERARVLDVERSFIVQAPAGSGKTGLLVLRFLALLARVERPEAVLAITFTRKAAAEMRHRIVDALIDAQTRIQPPAKDFERERWELACGVLARDAALDWGLLQSPSRLQVFTIDSFCARVVAGTPLLSRLGSTPNVVDDSTPLYREAVRRVLAPSGRALLAEPLEILLERNEMGMDRLEAQLMRMLSSRDQWREGVVLSAKDEQSWVAGIESRFAAAIAHEVESIAAGAEPGIVARIHELARRSRDVVGAQTAWPTLGGETRLGPGLENAAAWKQAAALLTKENGKKLRTPRTKDADVYAKDAALKADFARFMGDLGDTPEVASRWLAMLRSASKLPVAAAFTDDGRAALAALLSVLRHADAMLWDVFRERREVDHVEVAMRAVEALFPGETLEKMDARLEHILVDEFQDTNVLQCNLLRGLTSGWQQDEGRTLFLVGDPMQSIYRFRKAEVGLFLAARSNPAFLGDCQLVPSSLSVNFRSTRKVVDWVNRTFRTLFGTRDDATRSLVSFAAAEPKPKADDGIDVDFVLWTSGGAEKGAEADAVEAAGLADWIVDRLGAIRESDRERGEERDPRDVPIAVLVRGRAHALPLLRALESRAREVRVRAPGLDHLGDRTTAIDLEALTRALLHRGDRLSWLALLRSPWVGLTLQDLAALVEPDVAERGSAFRACAIPLLLRDPAALARLEDEARARIARLVAVMDAASRELATRSIDVVVRAAWLRLGGLASTRERVSLEALDAEAFFDLLATCAGDGRVDLDDLARRLREAEAPVDLDAEVDLEIMTMHKAKGLEFDTVVLPGLGRTTGGNDALPLAMETKPDSGRLTLITPSGARGRDDADSDKYDFLRHREATRGDNETLRLLYVAATRTRRCLLLSSPAGRLKKGGLPASHSLLDALAPAVDVADARLQTVAPTPPPAKRPSLRFPASFSLAAAPASVPDRSVVAESPSLVGQTAPEFFADGKLPAHIGTVYHAFLERIAADGVSVWPVSRIADEHAAIQFALRGEGVLAAEMSDATARVVAALEETLRDERGVWMLDAHVEARSEWAMTSWRKGKMVSAQIDRTFVADGARWVVDFKTGGWNPDRDEDVEGAAALHVALKRAQYADQLAGYRDLVRDAPGGDALPIRLALYFAEWPQGRRWQDITDLVDAADACS